MCAYMHIRVKTVGRMAGDAAILIYMLWWSILSMTTAVILK